MTTTTYFNKVNYFLPLFLVYVVLPTLLIGLFRWLFCIWFPIFDISEDFWTILIPLLFPGIPLFIWMRKRLNVFSINGDSKNSTIAILMISWVIMSAMLYFSQIYLSTATGQLQTLSSINEIDKHKESRYYKLKSSIVANQSGGHYASSFIGGKKNNRHYYYELYLVSPMYIDTSVKNNQIPKIWCGVKFTEKMHINTSVESRNTRYAIFYNQSVEKMKKYNFSNVNYFERTPTSSDKNGFLFAVENSIQQKTDESFVVLEPKFDNFDERNGNNLLWFLTSFGIGLIFLLFALTKVDFIGGSKQM